MAGPKKKNPTTLVECRKCGIFGEHYTRPTANGPRKVNPCIRCHLMEDRKRSSKRKLDGVAQEQRRAQWRRANSRRQDGG